MRLRGGVDILVATPGRLLDLVNQNAVKLDKVETLVLDEADRMLDMGFIRDIRKIIAFLPKKRQNLLFSATFSEDIRQLTTGLLVNPIKIEVAARNTAAETVEQIAYLCNKANKADLLWPSNKNKRVATSIGLYQYQTWRESSHRKTQQLI